MKITIEFDSRDGAKCGVLEKIAALEAEIQEQRNKRLEVNQRRYREQAAKRAEESSVGWVEPMEAVQ